MARAVIVISVPYPNIGDTRVKLRARNMVQDDWLTVQAMSAVAQVLGRSLRHASGWSAVLLVDARYNSEQYKKLLPTLVGKHLRNWRLLGGLLHGIEHFFRER